MSEVWVFDVGVVGSGSMNGGPGWYRQVAVGQVPEGRVDFCVVVVAARDGSSNNMYALVSILSHRAMLMR